MIDNPNAEIAERHALEDEAWHIAHDEAQARVEAAYWAALAEAHEAAEAEIARFIAESEEEDDDPHTYDQ